MTKRTKILLKKSGVENKKPTELDLGEIALNYHDGNIYYKNTSEKIAEMKRLDSRLNETNIVDMVYDVEGNLTEVHYETGNVMKLIYDENDNLHSSQYFGVDGITHLFSQMITYDINGNVKSTEWVEV